MKKITLLFIIASLFIGGCEWRTFEFTGTVDIDEEYILDSKYIYSTNQVITSSQVRDAFDLPEEGEVKDVQIESMSVRVTLLEGNEANYIYLTGYVIEGNEELLAFENYNVPLVGINIPVLGLNSLISAGVGKIRNKLIGYLKRSDDDSFIIKLEANPFGARVHAKIDLLINGSVIYEECLEVLPGMGGESCEGN